MRSGSKSARGPRYGSAQPSHAAFDVGHRLDDRDFVVGNSDTKVLLEGLDEFHGIERIEAEAAPKRDVWTDLIAWHSEQDCDFAEELILLSVELAVSHEIPFSIASHPWKSKPHAQLVAAQRGHTGFERTLGGGLCEEARRAREIPKSLRERQVSRPATLGMRRAQGSCRRHIEVRGGPTQ